MEKIIKNSIKYNYKHNLANYINKMYKEERQKKILIEHILIKIILILILFYKKI